MRLNILIKWIISIFMIINSANILSAQNNVQVIRLANAKVMSNGNLKISFELYNDSENDAYLLLRCIFEKSYVENEFFCIELIENIDFVSKMPIEYITRFPSLTVIPSQSRYVYTFKSEYFPDFKYNFNFVTYLKIKVLLFPYYIEDFSSFNEYIEAINQFGEEIELICPLLVVQ